MPLLSVKRLSFILIIGQLACLSSSATIAQSIIVQLLNGKNGKPIAKAKIDISFDGTRNPLHFTTDSQGEVRFDADGSQSFEVHQIGYATCDEQPYGSKPRDYSIDGILKSGLISANNCGHIRVQRERGRLVFFVRHGTWTEWLKQ